MLPVPTWGWHGTVYVTVSVCPTVDDFCSGGYQYTRHGDPGPGRRGDRRPGGAGEPRLRAGGGLLRHPGQPGRRASSTWCRPTPVRSRRGSAPRSPGETLDEAVALQAARCPTDFIPHQPMDDQPRPGASSSTCTVRWPQWRTSRSRPTHCTHKVITDPDAPEGTSLKVLRQRLQRSDAGAELRARGLVRDDRRRAGHLGAELPPDGPVRRPGGASTSTRRQRRVTSCPTATTH